MPSLSTFYKDQLAEMTRWRALIVTAWFGAPEVEQAREFAVLCERVASEHPEGTALVNIVVRGLPTMDDATRDVLNTVAVRHGRQRRAVAQIVLLDGFAGVGVRAYLSTLRLLSRTEAPTKVARTIAEGAEWLDGRMRGEASWTWEPGELREALEKLAAG